MKQEEILQLMQARHSVRAYRNQPIETEKILALQAEIQRLNGESGLCFVLVTEEPEVFQANRPHYGYFSGCRNYFVLFGKKGDDEKIGYFGEQLVLKAQELGLNTCWVALTFEKKKLTVEVPEGMKLFDVIALGYGENPGRPHKSKPLEKMAKFRENPPEWFLRGMEGVLLAPTAINQQQVVFRLTEDGKVEARALPGPCNKTDLGICKLHFEWMAGKENFRWAED